MLEMWQRQHTQTFPKRIKVWRRLQNDINIVDYEGLYEKVVEKTAEGSIEARSLWIRRRLPDAIVKNVMFAFLGLATFGFVGWLLGAIGQAVFHIPLIDLILAGLLGFVGFMIGWVTGKNVELFEIPAPSQSAYREGSLANENRDVLWLLQTGLNDFHPLVYQSGSFIATIHDKIPIYNWIPLKDADGKPVLDAQGRPQAQRGEFIRFDYEDKKVVLFDTNHYLTGEKDNLVVEEVPYVVAYKNTDTFQWLLMQAERAARFYKKGSWWDKYGTTATMVIGCMFILIIFVVGLQQYNSINTTLVNGLTQLGDKNAASTSTTSAAMKLIAEHTGTTIMPVPVPPA